MKLEKPIKLWGLVNKDSGRLYSWQFYRTRKMFNYEIKQAKAWGYDVEVKKFLIFRDF